MSEVCECVQFWKGKGIGCVQYWDWFRHIPIFFQGFFYHPQRYSRLLLCLSRGLVFGRGLEEARYPVVEVSADFG